MTCACCATRRGASLLWSSFPHLPQVSHGDYNAAVHRSGFLKDKLDQVLPGHMTTSKRRVEFERRVLFKYAEVSQLNVEDTQVPWMVFYQHNLRFQMMKYGLGMRLALIVPRLSH